MAKTTKKTPAANAKKAMRKKATKPAAKAEGKKLSQVEAAIKVLTRAGEPMNCKAMVGDGQTGIVDQSGWRDPCGHVVFINLARPAEWQGRSVQEDESRPIHACRQVTPNAKRKPHLERFTRWGVASSGES